MRTTRLIFFGDIAVVRNNEFKNYVLRAGDKDARVSVPLAIDFGESLEQVESILKEELPRIHAIICDKTDARVDGPNYIGVTKISEYGVQLSFFASCKGKDVFIVTNTLNRELKLMCEHHGILIAHRSFTNQSRVG